MRENELRSRLQKDAERLQETFSEELFNRIMQAVYAAPEPEHGSETPNVSAKEKGSISAETQSMSGNTRSKMWISAASYYLTAVSASVCLGIAIWSFLHPHSGLMREQALSSNSSTAGIQTPVSSSVSPGQNEAKRPHSETPHHPVSSSPFQPHFSQIGEVPFSAPSLETILPEQVLEIVRIAAPSASEREPSPEGEREIALQSLEKMSVLILSGQPILQLGTLAGDRNGVEEQSRTGDLRENERELESLPYPAASSDAAAYAGRNGESQTEMRSVPGHEDALAGTDRPQENSSKDSTFTEFWNETSSVISVPLMWIFQEE